MPSLKVIPNDGRSYNFPILNGEITIGRNKDNNLILSEDFAHFVIDANRPWKLQQYTGK